MVISQSGSRIIQIHWRQIHWRQIGAKLAPRFRLALIGADWRQLAVGVSLFITGIKRQLAVPPITAKIWRSDKFGDRQLAPKGAYWRQSTANLAPIRRQNGANLAVVRNRQLLAPIGANFLKKHEKSHIHWGLWRQLAPIWRRLAPFGAKKLRTTRSSILP